MMALSGISIALKKPCALAERMRKSGTIFRNSLPCTSGCGLIPYKSKRSSRNYFRAGCRNWLKIPEREFCMGNGMIMEDWPDNALKVHGNNVTLEPAAQCRLLRSPSYSSYHFIKQSFVFSQFYALFLKICYNFYIDLKCNSHFMKIF